MVSYIFSKQLQEIIGYKYQTGMSVTVKMRLTGRISTDKKKVWVAGEWGN
jgi:hypothetical protein